MFFQDIIRTRALKAAQKAEMKAVEGELRAAAEKLIKSPEFQEHVAALDSLFQPKFGREFNSVDVFLLGSAGKNGLLELKAFTEVVADVANGKRISPQLISRGHLSPNAVSEVPYIGVSAEASSKQVFTPKSDEPYILQTLKAAVNNTKGGVEFVNKEIAGKRTNGIEAKDVVFPPQWNEDTLKAAHEHIDAIGSHLRESGLLKAHDAYLAVNQAHAAAERAVAPVAKTMTPARTATLQRTVSDHSRIGSQTAEAETALF